MNALALVIGNANYAASKHKLINAVNDANDIGERLSQLGFLVKKSTDCNREEFERVVIDFGNELKNFDVGLFYFSGHGIQINSKNYLTSIDTSFVDTSSLKHSSFPLDELIERMQEAKASIKILILDACRDNPLPNTYRGIGNEGLAPIHAPKGTIIAFSTSPGERALDYGAGNNSIYTGALLNHINDTNIPIETFFKRVRTSVFTMSGGKQTSWEHTSLIGTFCFNSGQLIHSVELPYKDEHIADENFQSDGSSIDEVIEGLRSHNYYKQEPAIKCLASISPGEIDGSTLFLLGRNILQTAIGGEYSAKRIIDNLPVWLSKYSAENENHVLNGILFEIYFNSKGRFREHNFKNELLEQVFKLQTNKLYESSFQFIKRQLEHFRAFVFYVPTNPPIALPIEVMFDTFNYNFGPKDLVGHKLISIKHEGVELLEPYTDDDFESRSLTYLDFFAMLCKELCVPKHLLRLTMNEESENIKLIIAPWTLKLKRQNAVVEEATA